MFENKTQENIHNDLLAEIDEGYDQSEGSFIFDATRPAAIELEKAYMHLDEVMQKMSIEALKDDELEQRIYEQTGLQRKPATRANGLLKVIGTGKIPKGAIFQTEAGIQYEAEEEKDITNEGTVAISCLLMGSIGNMPTGMITVMTSTISGIVSVTNDSPIGGGYEAETDEGLKERYYEKKQSPATSGNIAQYRSGAKSVTGVGDAKVVPLWNGNNTVKVVIINAEMLPAESALVDEVQTYIDPGSTGLGEGMAPIGARCTVESAVGLSVHIACSIVKSTSISDEQVKSNIEDKLKQYFREIAFDKNTLSYAIVGALILECQGVEDYSNLRVNGATDSLTLSEFQVPMLGGVTLE
ncbi:baseplate J/gp47 family protein [Vallitalea okinawensis]|uniref:baseplate J/gp47 family protein n=1 Tax=Vallitalea okinawensis TaxID=2078660 RepID=UPI000CFD7D6A|nr:baseplate J/gp47 family protein [Vallitalea okinawensis]